MDTNLKKGPASAGPAFDALARVTKIASGAVLVILVVLVCGEATLRSVAHVSLDFIEELSGYCVVMLTFFGAALALRSGSLFQVNFIFDTLPAGARIWLQRLFIILAIAVSALLAWKATDLMVSSLERGKFAPTSLRTPLWIPQMLMPAGFAVIGVFLIEQLLLSGRKLEAED
jgi:TRAP-type C4-dicarboxylate transport system permease small subunit